MQPPPVPEDEDERLAALHAYEILDSLPERAFDDLVRLASHLLNTPIALISLVDRDRQWFKARHGLDAQETSREVSFCAHTLATKTELVIEDVRDDARFADNPLVLQHPHIGSYAGAPILTSEGHALGTICVIDRAPRAFRDDEIRLLKGLARQVMDQLELRMHVEEAKRDARRQKTLVAQRDRILATATHELRTPLTSILGSIDLVTNGVAGELPEPALELLSVAQRNALRLRETINSLLDLRRAQADHMAEPLEPLNLVETVREGVVHNAAFAAQRGVFLRVDAPDDAHVPIRGSASSLLRVMDNLLSNAIKHSPEGSTVSASIAQHERRARVDVVDSGPGLDPQLRARIFEPFVRGKSSEGTGLGLAIAREIVELHDGRLDAEDAEPTGARFAFTLPIYDGSAHDI